MSAQEYGCQIPAEEEDGGRGEVPGAVLLVISKPVNSEETSA